MTRPLIAVLLVACIAVSLSAQTPPGFGSGLFARGEIDARAAAMGGVLVAIAAGGPAVYYNPAGLARTSRLQLGGMYSEPYGEAAGVTFQSVSIVGPLGTQTDSLVDGLGVGLAWRGTTVSGIPMWDESGSGALFSAVGSVYSVSAAIPVSVLADCSIGATAKYYSASILEGRAQGFGLDVGALASFVLADTPVHIGWNAMDIMGTTIHWRDTAGEPDNYIPWINKLGAAIELFSGKALLACDFDWAVGRPEREQTLHLGVEIRIVKELALRAGWETGLEGDGSISAGVGVYLLSKLAIDYAYLPGKAIGSTHILSVQMSF